MLYLASASPRRRALLEQAGVPFVVVRSDVQEHFQKGMAPKSVAATLAARKAWAAPVRPGPGEAVLGADTVVALEGRALGKPADAEEAAAMTGGDIKPIYSVETKEKKIAISFDAAWGADKTAGIMDILDQHNVKATFFLVGFWIDKYPDMVKTIAQRGYEIGNHSLNHPHMPQLTKEQMTTELKEVNAKLKELTGKEAALFRPPFGDYNDTLVTTVNELGMHCIQWSVDSLDWKELGVKEMTDRVLKNVKEGSIVLFHNNSKYILDALPGILKELQKKYEIVPVGELIYTENYTVDRQGIQHKAG